MATILIVDDEKPMRQFLVAAFEQEGHQVLEASHGRQALNMLADTHPDIVISDVMMPLVGGVELCSVLKGDPSTAHIPVVLMSAAYSGTRTISAADAIVGKPFDLDTMDAIVRRLLAARRSREG